MGKARGDKGLIHDLLKCCGGALFNFIVTMLTIVWRESSIMFLLNGMMPSLFLCSRKKIYHLLIIGKVLVSWM